jgi:hypothetical protein
VGDSAGLTNPINGEGIQYALLSGRMAAEAAVSCARKNDFSRRALAAYSVQVEKLLNYDMAVCGLIYQFIRNRTLRPVYLRVLRDITARANVDASYAGITGGILAGLEPAGKALSLKVLGGTIEQAAVSLGIDSLRQMFAGPGNLSGAGINAICGSAEMAYDVAKHPWEFLKWGLDITTTAAGLVTQWVKAPAQSYKAPGLR